jgi:DhnA family fructose-bisphosphate aldolase class Ia
MAYQPFIPADVPALQKEKFLQHYQRICKNTDRLFLFVVDHKMEHLNDDFASLDQEIQDPEHIFKIAQLPEIGAFASHPGLIERHAAQFPTIPYIMKLNGKTNLNKTSDPFSAQLWSVEQAVHIADDAKIDLCGVALTIYLGSSFEDRMLAQAADMIYQAHQNGLIALLWMYPRGKSVTDESDAHLIAGAAGMAHELGADFAKVHAPHATAQKRSEELLQEAVAAAGNTAVICAGGSRTKPDELVENIKQQIAIGGTKGCAIGRNLFQLPFEQARALTQEISQVVYSEK